MVKDQSRLIVEESQSKPLLASLRAFNHAKRCCSNSLHLPKRESPFVNTAVASLFLVYFSIAGSTMVAARSIYLNGIDISNAQSQDIENVSIHISENGDLFIIAPHYQVNEEETFLPLSRLNTIMQQSSRLSNDHTPIHKRPGKLTAKAYSTPSSQLPPVPTPDSDQNVPSTDTLNSRTDETLPQKK